MDTTRRENIGLKKKAFSNGLIQRKNGDYLGSEGGIQIQAGYSLNEDAT